MAFIRPYEDRDKEACGEICIQTLPPSLSTAPDPRVQKLAPYVWTHQFTYLSPGTCHVLDDGTGKVVGYCIGCADLHAMRKEYGRFVEDVLVRDWVVDGNVDGDGEKKGLSRDDEGEKELWRGKGERVSWSIPTSNPDGSRGGGDDEWELVVNYKALEQLAFRDDLLLLPPTLPSSSSSSSSKPQDSAARTTTESMTTALSDYRATMHIDLLPPFQGQGWGRKLIETFVESVSGGQQIQNSQKNSQEEDETGRKKKGKKGEEDLNYGAGIWIGVSPENRKVLSFYDRMGFRLVMNDDVEGIVLVKDIPPRGC